MRLGPSLRTYSASAGGEIDPSTGALIAAGLVVTVPRYARHDWGRADYWLQGSGGGGDVKRVRDWGEEVVVEEWTAPMDLAKALFFWNLNGVVMGAGDADAAGTSLLKTARWVLGGWWVPFQLFVIFWELDNWPVFLSLEGYGIGGRLERGVEYVVSFLVLFVVGLVGRVLGVKAVAEERTPIELWTAWQKGLRSERKED